MKLLTVNEELLINGASASERPAGLKGIPDYFIKGIADSINRDFNKLVLQGAGMDKFDQLWDQRVLYYKVNPDLFNAVVAQLRFPIMPDSPSNPCTPIVP